MRSTKLWLTSILGLAFSLALSIVPAWALPIPKLPPEATDKPSVAVRIRPIAELIKDARYIAKLVDQGEVFDAVEPGVAPFLEAFDQKKPIGFYGKISPKGTDSYGIVMVPVKNLKDFIGMLNTVGVNPAEGEGGLYTVNAPGFPFPILFRHVNGYLYGTMRNSAEAEAALAVNKLLAPQAVFKGDDDSIASVTFNVDAVPNDHKKKALEMLEEGLKKFQQDELPKIDNAAAKTALETVSEELAIKLQSLIVDAQTVTLRLEFDRTKETIGTSVKLVARPTSALAADLNNMADRQGLAAGLLGKGSVAHFSVNAAVPAALKKTLDPIVDEFVAKAWKKVGEKEQPYVKELVELLGPTMKSGILDFGFDLRGPDRDDRYAGVLALKMTDGDKLDGLVRKVVADFGKIQTKIKLDVGKAGDVKINQLQPDKNIDKNAEDLFGEDPAFLTGFRKDALLIAVGPNSEAMTAMKNAAETTAKSSAIMQGQMSIRRMAPFFDRKEAGSAAAIRKTFADGVDDTARFSLAGGSSLDFRLSTSSRVIQLGYLMEKSRRGRQ